MIVVTVELLPGGAKSLRRCIATMHIANSSELADISDYSVHATESANPLTGSDARVAECKVLNHVRRQHVWVLLRAAIEGLENAGWVSL